MRRRFFRNNNTRYFIAAMVIIVAFLLLGGAKWVSGQLHGLDSSLNWLQIFISLILGFLIGMVVCRRKWF